MDTNTRIAKYVMGLPVQFVETEYEEGFGPDAGSFKKRGKWQLGTESGYLDTPDYCSNSRHAWEVVEKLKEDGYSMWFHIGEVSHSKWTVEITADEGAVRASCAQGLHLPQVICTAALQLKEGLEL